MKTTIGEVRQIVRSVLIETVNEPVKIGGLASSIGGDTRYMDYLAVFYNPDDSVTVVVSSSAPVGGMDGPGGVHSPDESFRRKTKPGARAADVMKVIKSVISNDDYSFKRYGKPSKNFYWKNVGKGLNTSLCNQALEKVRNPVASTPTVSSQSQASPLSKAWDAAAPGERVKFLQTQMDFEASDVEKLSQMTYHQVIDQFDPGTLGDFKHFARTWFFDL